MLISEQCKLDRINFREPQDDAKTYKQKETIRARFEGHDIHGENGPYTRRAKVRQTWSLQEAQSLK
eukprot:TRINITY_DN1137_c0_g1_i1.p3 TRINITY_DN1137_c0_g1~~TRINITY_DN1137_c0_g1_i1.p3  ORF type:complete len:66 (+),score=0.18 TRINITY_DN1137_c0_g1_i1:74-271(+)